MYKGNILLLSQAVEQREEKLEELKSFQRVLLGLLENPQNYSAGFHEDFDAHELRIKKAIEHLREAYTIEVYTITKLEEQLKRYKVEQRTFESKGY